MLLLEQMLVLFMLMGAGFFCSKKSIITEEVGRKLSAVIVNIANPAMILSSCMENDRIQKQELLETAVLAVLVYAGLLLLAQILPPLLRIERQRRGAYRVMTVFTNIGFMGFPVIAAVYGRDALLYATVFVVVLNVLIYTYGIAAMQPGRRPELKRIVNVGVMACAVGLTIYLLDIPIPLFLQRTAGELGRLTAPLSMMVIGASLAAMDIKSLFTDKPLLLFAGIRLLAVPVIAMALIGRFVANEMLLGVCMIVLAAPAASMTTMLAQQYGGDQETTSKGVALTTVLSVATIPFVQILLGYLL